MINNKAISLFEKVKKARIFNNIRDLYQLDNKAVLDVGCSEGHYLACFGSGSVGLTIIEEHVAYGRALGLEIINQNVEDPDFQMDRKFDAVWANNFLEHMNSPHLFLRKMSDNITPGGVIILGVPIFPTLPFLTRFKKFRGVFASSHVNFFNRRTLIETIRYAGYEVLEARLFYFKNPVFDAIMNLIAPHMYVIARPNTSFAYSEKRMKSLRGYQNYSGLSEK